MKFSTREINSMSYQEWMETITKELNEAGFKGEGYNAAAGRFIKNVAPYKVNDVSTFFMGSINDASAMDYLKSIELVNNGRCPMCGAVIKGTPSRFSDGMNPNLNFQICLSCRKEGQRISINPANNSGCILAFVVLPWSIIKTCIY